MSQESIDARSRAMAAPLSADPAMDADPADESAGGPTIREALCVLAVERRD